MKVKPIPRFLFLGALLLFFVFARIAVGDSLACRSYNLMQTESESLSPIPVYDQGATNTCYAHVLSQQLEYALRKQGKWVGQDHISPYWLATVHKTEGNPLVRIRSSRLGFSSVHLALHDLKDSKICRPSTLSAGLERTKGPIRLADEDFFYLFEKFWNYTVPGIEREFGFALEQLQNEEIFKDWWTLKVLESREISESAIAEMFERVRELRLAAPKVTEFTRYMRDYVFGDCRFENLLKFDIPVFSPLGRGMFYETNQSLKTQVEKILSGARHPVQPAVIGYCDRVYNSAREEIPWFSFLLPRVLRATLFESRCGPHYSLIVAQKAMQEDKTGCQYLIRNTKGARIFSKQDECLCDFGTGSPTRCTYQDVLASAQKPKAVLGCWVRGSELLPEIFDLAYLRF